MKLTEAQYKALLLARDKASLCAEMPELDKPHSQSGSEKAIESLRTATILTHLQANERFVAAFMGARLLSLNELLRLDLRVINKYRTLWHKRAHESLLVSGKTPTPQIDGAVRLTIFRQGKRLVDNDGLAASFKFAIDGFKEAGLIGDDNPTVVQNIPLMQRKGEYAAALMFESIDTEHRPQYIQKLTERTKP